MHLSTILLPLALSAAALAAPSTNTTTPFPLTKRATYGWLSSYAPDDTTCKGFYYKPARPKVYADCLKFSPVSDNVGINWGTWPLSYTGLDIFSDDNCKVSAGPRVDAPPGDFNNPSFHKNKGANTCFSVKKQAKISKGQIKSVKAFGIYFD